MAVHKPLQAPESAPETLVAPLPGPVGPSAESPAGADATPDADAFARSLLAQFAPLAGPVEEVMVYL